MSSETVRLASGPLRLEVHPELGGAIGAFELERRGETVPLMRGRVEESLKALGPRALASFPLAPYSNRILGGSFDFDGAHIAERPNMLPHPHPLHGHAWLASFRVNFHSAERLELAYEHSPSAWPWRYSVVQRFALTDDALSIELVLENRSAKRMPAGIGHHPYFECNSQTRLTARLGELWEAVDFYPKVRVAVPPKWDFSRPKRVADLGLDHCFAGFDGQAVIDWPDRAARLTLKADPVFSHAVIYTPSKTGYFCFEPVSHANDAFNLTSKGVPGTGVCILEPGEALRGSLRFSVEG